MITFSEYLVTEAEEDNTFYARSNIGNTEVLYQVAMRAKSATDLEKGMKKMFSKFPDREKIDLKKVNWKSIYTELNEVAQGTSILIEGFKTKEYDEMMDGLDTDKFTSAMYDWFQDNYPDAPINSGDATPDEFIDLLDRENDGKMIKKFYKDMKKFL